MSWNVQICPWSPKGPFLTFSQKKMSHSEFSHATLFPSNFFQSSNICQRLTSPAVEVKRESSSLLLGFPKKRKRRKKKDLVVLGVLGPFRSRTLHPPLSAQPPLLDLRTHLSKSQCVEERARTQLQCAKARARPRAFCRRRSWRDPWQPWAPTAVTSEKSIKALHVQKLDNTTQIHTKMEVRHLCLAFGLMLAFVNLPKGMTKRKFWTWHFFGSYG